MICSTVFTVFQDGDQLWWPVPILVLFLIAAVVLGRRIFETNYKAASFARFNAAILLNLAWSAALIIFLGNRNILTQTDKSIRLATILILILFIVIRLVLEIRNYRLEIKSLRAKLQSDSLTSLPNRVVVLEHLAQFLESVDQRVFIPTVIHLNIDRFKSINDVHGHSVGDALLVEISQRLREFVEQKSLVARLAGDEFVVIDTQTKTAMDSVVLADKILASLVKPFLLNHGEVFVSASIGVAAFQKEQPKSAPELLSNAESAMYWAKEAGRNCVAVFDESMDQRTKNRLAIETALYGALERKELRLVHQPIIDIDLGDVTGFEALMRWDDSDGNSITPDVFIPIAEETGIIMPIGAWALLEALIHLRGWINEGVCSSDATMSVNVSSRQLHDPKFTAIVNEALIRSHMPAEQLWLEVTESVMITQPEQALETLRSLSALGVRIAIDDFGTGYSSLSFLQRFPIHRLKIDKSFVSNIVSDKNVRTLVKTIIAMAESLDLEVVAEGVETAPQLHALADLRCGQAQGFLISHPLPPDEIPKALLDLNKIGKWPRLREVK